MSMENQSENKLVRLLTGIVAVTLSLAGVWLYFTRPDSHPVPGVLIRIGLVTGVIWLAFKELVALRSRVPTAAMGVGLLILGVMAAIPNRGRFFVALLTITIGVAGALKWLTKVADSAPKRKK
ncbi:MAG: hypothetical protein AB8B55_12135 [Mariniblastus sp.]